MAIAQAGVPVVLHEMRPKVGTDAHKTGGFAELVCSNSFRSDDADQNAVGLLHWEMRAADSLIMEPLTSIRCRQAAHWRWTARLSRRKLRRRSSHPLVTVEYDEIAGLPPEDWDSVIVATGPLTSPALSKAIGQITGEADLAFFDAIAPIIHRETINMDKAWFQSRYDKVGPGGTGKDYINCPMTGAV